MLIYSANSGSPFGAMPPTVTVDYKRVCKRKRSSIRKKVADRQQRQYKTRKGKTEKTQLKKTIKGKKETGRKKKKRLYAKNVNFLKKLGLRVKKQN